MPPVDLAKNDKVVKPRNNDSPIKSRIPTPGPVAEEPINGNAKLVGRQSDLQSTMDVNEVLDRLLNLPLPLSIGEAFAFSKEIRNGIQERIRMKNVKAVLIGRSSNHPILANWTWQRSEGVLIKVEMETTAGRKVLAIVDTGSQLDVVRADIAALIIHRPVDMTCITNMNDASGGRGQLRGRIDGVEFNCGGVTTKTDLWVLQQAPFELLLGRPWQRSNLVSIDEREEGTYLVFKDPETRRPRYELLAIPHDAHTDAYPYLRTPDALAYISEELRDTPPLMNVDAPIWKEPDMFAGIFEEFRDAPPLARVNAPIRQEPDVFASIFEELRDAPPLTSVDSPKRRESDVNDMPPHPLTRQEPIYANFAPPRPILRQDPNNAKIAPPHENPKPWVPTPHENAVLRHSATPHEKLDSNKLRMTGSPNFRRARTTGDTINELCCEVIQLWRLLLAIFSLIAGGILICGEIMVGKLIERGTYKGRPPESEILHPQPPLLPSSQPPLLPSPQLPTHLPSPTASFSALVSASSHAMTGLQPHISNKTPPTELRPSESPALSRERYGTYGRPDAREFDPREPRIIERIVNRAWAAHLKDEPVQVRPGLLSTPQFVYLGREDDDEQEIHHGVMLNAQLLIHNPESGTPGSQNGHAYVKFEAAPADDNEKWSREVPYAEDEAIRELIRQYEDRVTHAPEEEWYPAELDDANAERTPAEESSAPNPEPVASLDNDETNSSGMSPSTTRPRYHYVSLPANAAPPFDISHMEPIGTSHGDVIMRFQLRDDAPTACDDAQTDELGSPMRFDTPALPYRLEHHCPPLDDRTRQGTAPSKDFPLNEAPRLPGNQGTRKNATKTQSLTRLPTSALYQKIAAQPSVRPPPVPDTIAARLCEQKRKTATEAPQPPVTELGDSSVDSAADRVEIPVFRRRGAPISRSQYSSSSSSSSSRDTSPYERQLAALDDAITERSACSDDSEIDPRLLISVAAAEAQRQLAREQPRPIPFVGMLATQPPPPPPHIDADLTRPKSPGFPHRFVVDSGSVRHFTYRSRSASSQPGADLFTWTPIPAANTTFFRPPSYCTKPGADLINGRPRTLFDPPPPRTVQSPAPALPPHHRRAMLHRLEIDLALQRDSPASEVLKAPEYITAPTSPTSDTSMPSLRPLSRSLEPGEIREDAYTPHTHSHGTVTSAAAASARAEPSHSPSPTTRSDTVVNVPLKDILAALRALRHEFPFDEELCRRAVWRRVEPWHYLREQQAKIQRHNENLMAIRPIEDALYIFLNKVAKILDHPMMSLGDFLEIQRISRLPPDTPAEEVIRARGRLVCSFVDLPARPNYDDAIDLAAGDLASVSFVDPSGEQQLQFNASLPPSPRGQRARERQFNDDALRKGAIYMAALKAEYYRNASIISSLSDARLGLLEGLRQLDRLVSRRQWAMDLHVLHRLEPNPMPILYDEEYAKLRILGDTFEACGDVTIHDLIDRVFRLRFRQSSLLSHFLFSGLLDPTYAKRDFAWWECGSHSDDSDDSDDYILRHADHGASPHPFLSEAHANLEVFVQSHERRTYSPSHLSTTSSHEDGRPASAPPTLDRGDLSARSRDDRMPATYNHDYSNISFLGGRVNSSTDLDFANHNFYLQL
ncbi:hypothetical protein C8J57DRAFT_1535068 [Mycena rebaudengoi]|nr:hypothetical protein C8J57DRAFT_1535068 [Mycena rebaudengoi]